MLDDSFDRVCAPISLYAAATATRVGTTRKERAWRDALADILAISPSQLLACPVLVARSMSDSRLTVAQMSAEILRELGVLVVAFVPLDYLFAERSSLTVVTVGAIVALGIVLLVSGMLLEGSRPS